MKKKNKEPIEKIDHTDIEYRKKIESLILNKDYTSPIFWKKALKDRFFRSVSIVVNMELNSGVHKTFLQILDRDGSFKFQKKRYLYDTECRYWNQDLQMYCIDYHEEFTIPIKRIIHVDNIKKNIRDSYPEISQAVNPMTIDNFTKSKIAEGIMKGQEISEYLRKYGLLITFILIIVLSHFLIWAYRTGMFSQITGAVGLG